MANPATLQLLAAQTRTTAETQAAQARTESAAAQQALTAAVDALSAATTAWIAQGTEVERIRTALAVIPTTADAKPLLDQLDAATIAQRAAEAGILAAERTLALARARVERALAAARLAEGAAVAAIAAVGTEERAAAARGALVTALGAPALSTLPADATALLASTRFTAAQTATAAGLPAKLLARARSRASIAAERSANRAAAFASMIALADGQVAASGSIADKAGPPQRHFDAAVAALQAYVTNARLRFDRAQATLVRLADPQQKLVLTAQQIARLDDAALKTARETAADHELAVDEAARDVAKATDDRDIEQLKHNAGVTDDLAAKETALTAKQTALTTANTAFTAAERALLKQWAAAAPDAIWRDVAAFDAAKAALTDLAAHPPAVLVATVGAKETALITALVDAGKARTAAALVDAAGASRVPAVAFDDGAAERSAFAALRGDA
jgi:hypothetical protein